MLETNARRNYGIQTGTLTLAKMVYTKMDAKEASCFQAGRDFSKVDFRIIVFLMHLDDFSKDHFITTEDLDVIGRTTNWIKIQALQMHFHFLSK